jgi:hypothetical protein
MKQAREFFDPSSLPWRPAAGYPSGVWEQVLAGGEDEGATTVVTHDFWEEIYIVSGACEVGDTTYRAGMVAVRPPGMPHGPFRSAGGCVNFEVRYRAR